MIITADAFIKKWQAVELKERSAAQEHFIDLCRLLDEPTPADADKTGESYCFEKGAAKSGGGDGWADVWKRGHFGWEYKGKRKDLTAAFVQLQQYALALENPPLLVTCDLGRFVVHTNWTNTVSQRIELSLDDLRDATKRDILKNVMSAPERLRPGVTRQELTEKAAADFANLAGRLQARGYDPQRVAHFVNRLVFCMFAEDVQLLPNKMFSRMLEAADKGSGQFEELASALFAAMRKGGMVGFERVDHFNGGLFDDDEALPLESDDITLCRNTAALDWGEIDPSVLGTLFERGLDPAKRAQLGAHYTDREKIMMLVEPVIVRPLGKEWASTRKHIEETLERARTAKSAAARTKQHTAADGLYRGFLERLRSYRVLDPACGSGNFLYLALRALKDIEHRAGLEAEALGLQRAFPTTGPENLIGIELNAYAAELARVSVWVGEIQWMRRNGFDVGRNPILRPLDNIQCRDAVLDGDAEAQWPVADAIIGNPPFLGDKLMIGSLGEAYVSTLRDVYRGRVPGGADLVCYWFSKAADATAKGGSTKVGLVATNSIRGGANRAILDRIQRDIGIFEAWSDEPWTIDGAAVRVALICFGKGEGTVSRLNGQLAESINSDLTGSTADLTSARALAENSSVAFIGDQKSGDFDISAELARRWLLLPQNPNGRPNSDVLRPWLNGMDVVRRSSNRWIIDFGTEMSEQQASLYEVPFEFVKERVKPLREKVRRDGHRRYWWRHGEPRPGMRKAIAPLPRYLVTPRVAKHRVWQWIDRGVVPDCQLVVIARADDFAFGVLHSRFHEAWALRLGTSLEDRPRYTPSTTFETFPFPEGLTLDVPVEVVAINPHAQAVAQAASRLHQLRSAWLNPADLVRLEGEVVPGYPDFAVPVHSEAATKLSTRTLTALYNRPPQWLLDAHADLDAAVAGAYGWDVEIETEEALERLLALNLERRA